MSNPGPIRSSLEILLIGHRHLFSLEFMLIQYFLGLLVGRRQGIHHLLSELLQRRVCRISGLYVALYNGEHVQATYRPPHGYVAHFKIYDSYKVPFNIFPTLPQYHIQFSSTPSVKISRFNCCIAMFGQADFVLNTNFCSCSELGECHCVVVNASLHEVILRYHGVAYYVNFANKLLTDIGYGLYGVSVSDVSYMLNQDLEQLSCMIPNLQKLDLSQYQLCSNNVRGLRSIVHNCRNLVGLNLTNTHSQSLNPIWYYGRFYV